MQNSTQQRHQAKVEDSRIKTNTALMKDHDEKTTPKINNCHVKTGRETNTALQENGVVVSQHTQSDKNQLAGETNSKDRLKDLPQNLVYKSKFNHSKASTEVKTKSRPEEGRFFALPMVIKHIISLLQSIFIFSQLVNSL
jgi:hypothetical protein